MKTNILFTLPTLLLLLLIPVAVQASNEVERNLMAIQETGPAAIELLEDGESYSIEITSVGCFNGTRQTVVVSREADVLVAHFQDQIKILSAQEIQAFINFEARLRSLEMGGCSTIDTYVLRFRDQVYKTSDGTCSWFGGSKLLKMFA